MNYYSPNTLVTYVLLLSGVANLVIVYLVLRANPRSQANRSFSVFSFSIALWSVASFLFYQFGDTSRLQIIYGNLLFAGPMIIPGSFFYFALSFPRDTKINEWKTFLIFTTTFLFFISFPFSIVEFSNEGSPIYGYIFTNIYPFYFLFFIVGGMGHLLYKFFKIKGIHRAQLMYFFIGSFITVVLASVTNLLFPLLFGNFELASLGPSTTIILIGFVAYAITRYRLMDVRLVIFRSLVFGLIVFVIGGIFAAISTVIASMFSDFARIQSNIVSGVIVATLLTLFYQPLRKLIERATNTFLYKKSYNPDVLLGQITEVSSSILDLKQLLASIAKTLDEALHSQKLGIVLVDNDAKKLTVSYQAGFAPGVAEKLANYPKAVEILYQEVKRLGGLLVIDEMKTRYENGEFEPVDKELLLALYQNDIAVILPLHVKDEVVGIVVLGNKKSGDPYNSQDLNVLKIIGGQVAIAIENARLYDELKDFNVKLEDEVRRKTAQLRKANTELRRLDTAKSEFISIASHQLRTPLTVIKGYISMMQEGSFGEVPPKISENLNKVYVSNERLIALVENLLDISRIESGRQEFLWEKAQLEDIATGVVDNLKQTAVNKGLKLTLHMKKGLTPKILVDKNKIHEVMMNFVDNSIKYTSSGSIDVQVKSDKDAVTFCVRDTGKGIDSQIKNNLFKKFSRGKDSFRMHTEGVGLGLYVAKMIIDAHQGRIWADSQGADKGSMFCFSIPLDHKPKESAPKFGTKVK